jgi:hypothetical protein
MDQKVRISFTLPAELMVHYAIMQARIKKREWMEWERFANAVAEHLEGTQSSETSEPAQTYQVDPESPIAETIQADITCTQTTACKVETDEPLPNELPTLMEPAPATDNTSENGKRTVVRWTQEEDEYLRELLERFDNDFAKVAREMKTRNARQCKSRWELLNRPADENGKKKRCVSKDTTQE